MYKKLGIVQLLLTVLTFVVDAVSVVRSEDHGTDWWDEVIGVFIYIKLTGSF